MSLRNLLLQQVCCDLNWTLARVLVVRIWYHKIARNSCAWKQSQTEIDAFRPEGNDMELQENQKS